MSETPYSFQVTALAGIPLVQPGDDLIRLILDGLVASDLTVKTGDVLVITSKIISKAEGRTVRLADVQPGPDAYHYAEVTGKDPRLVELVLRESSVVSRASKGVLVVEHKLGFVCANAGIDQSNTEGGSNVALLLPTNPDATAAQLRDNLRSATGAAMGIVISDSHGRPFRMGNIGVAIGVAGIPALLDLRGANDLYERKLQITIQGYADLIASTAQLASGEGSEGRPVVHIRGLNIPMGDGKGTDLNRPRQNDLYR